MTTTTATNTTGTGTTKAATTAESRTKLNANFDTFVKMLTTQLQYQDPLNPTDTSEFTNQLVMYSQVEQQLSGNEKLDKLISLQQGQGVNAALNYLGWQVGAETKDLPLQNGGASFSLNLAKAAKTVTIAISNAEGKVVRSLTIEGNKFTPGTAQEIAWDGKDNDGNKLTDGAYSVVAVAKDTAGGNVTTTLRTFGVVTGIDLDDKGNTVLSLGHVKLSPDNVKAVRAYTTTTTNGTGT